MIDNYNKNLINKFLIFSTIFVCFFSYYIVAYGAVTVIDDFNSYDTGDLDSQSGWFGSEAFKVQATTTYEGLKAVEFPNTPFPPHHIYKGITSKTNGIFSVYLRIETASDINFILRETESPIFSVNFNLSNGVVFSGETIGTYTLDTWNNLEIEIDAGNDRGRGRYNGGTWSAWQAITFSQVDSIGFLGISGISYFDYITFDDAPVVNYDLNVYKNGTGTGTITGNGINCGVDCSETYLENTEITLIAVADSGSDFISWSGACSGSGSCILTMTENKNVTATFSTTPIYGCMDSEAKNYNPLATIDDSSCIYAEPLFRLSTAIATGTLANISDTLAGSGMILLIGFAIGIYLLFYLMAWVTKTIHDLDRGKGRKIKVNK